MDSKRLNLNEYREMVDKIITYKNSNNKMPPKVVVSNIEIHKEEYMDMLERVNKFILEVGRSPRSVSIKQTNEKHNLYDI